MDLKIIESNFYNTVEIFNEKRYLTKNFIQKY